MCVVPPPLLANTLCQLHWESSWCSSWCLSYLCCNTTFASWHSILFVSGAFPMFKIDIMCFEIVWLLPFQYVSLFKFSPKRCSLYFLLWTPRDLPLLAGWIFNCSHWKTSQCWILTLIMTSLFFAMWTRMNASTFWIRNVIFDKWTSPKC